MRITEQSSGRVRISRPVFSIPGTGSVMCESNPAFVSQGAETLSELMDRIDSAGTASGAEILSQEVFLSHPELFDPEILHRVQRPVTWTIEDQPSGTPRIRSRIWARTGAAPQHLSLGDSVCGTFFEDEFCRYLRLAGLRPDDAGLSRSAQTRIVFEQMEAGLQQVGMDFSHVVRTWFFNDDILSWYPDFNRVRTEFFRRRHVFESLVPASTGVGGRNPFRMALTAGLLAVQHKTDASSAYAVPSPLQSSALEYGSSFSRAVEIATPESRRLLVSGTASIGAAGETLHVNDLGRQIDRTFAVVRELLHSRDMDWDQVVRAHAYLRRSEDEAVVRRRLMDWDLERFPLLVTSQTICRKDLLFELELDAYHEVKGRSC